MLTLLILLSAAAARAAVPLTSIDVAAFVYDPWTPEDTIFGQHGTNWTEWELVRRAAPRFPGHLQPKVPLWGEIDTGLPETWSMLNAEALGHGVNVCVAVQRPDALRRQAGAPLSPATPPSLYPLLFLPGTSGTFTGGLIAPRTPSLPAAWRRFSPPITPTRCALL